MNVIKGELTEIALGPFFFFFFFNVPAPPEFSPLPLPALLPFSCSPVPPPRGGSFGWFPATRGLHPPKDTTGLARRPPPLGYGRLLQNLRWLRNRGALRRY